MSANVVSKPTGTRYPLPLYLNQKYVFDVLSMMERGFSQLETITARTSGEEEREGRLAGDVGFKNVFGLLSVSLGGGRSRQERTGEEREVSTQRVHTPNSLFARMRERLFEEGLVLEALDAEGLGSSAFVELPMRLEKNPLLESLETMLSLGEMAAIFEDAPSSGAKTPGASGSRKQRQQRAAPPSEAQQMLQQLNELVSQMTTGNVVDLLATPTQENAPSVVLTLDMAYATDPSLSDLIDGEYRVLGKVTRFIPEGSDETINLLRKTSLGKLQGESIKELGGIMNEMQSGPVTFPEFRTEIPAPVVQILPIGVFA